jgi:hypothetical protein
MGLIPSIGGVGGKAFSNQWKTHLLLYETIIRGQIKPKLSKGKVRLKMNEIENTKK